MRLTCTKRLQALADVEHRGLFINRQVVTGVAPYNVLNQCQHYVCEQKVWGASESGQARRVSQLCSLLTRFASKLLQHTRATKQADGARDVEVHKCCPVGLPSIGCKGICQREQCACQPSVAPPCSAESAPSTRELPRQEMDLCCMIIMLKPPYGDDAMFVITRVKATWGLQSPQRALGVQLGYTLRAVAHHRGAAALHIWRNFKALAQGAALDGRHVQTATRTKW
jgi:hypothetical protein